jgi:hypothetical protein
MVFLFCFMVSFVGFVLLSRARKLGSDDRNPFSLDAEWEMPKLNYESLGWLSVYEPERPVHEGASG